MASCGAAGLRRSGRHCALSVAHYSRSSADPIKPPSENNQTLALIRYSAFQKPSAPDPAAYVYGKIIRPLLKSAADRVDPSYFQEVQSFYDELTSRYSPHPNLFYLGGWG